MKHTGMEAPQGVWWKPAHSSEKLWVWIAFAWCMVLFAMMPLWHLKGGQNPSGIRHTVTVEDFRARTFAFAETYQVGEENGIPIVEPPPGSDIYLLGRMWGWYPILRLRQNAEYVLHLSSGDVNHGFSLHPFNLNFQVVPGYDYGLRVSPTEAGDFRIVCNEFCGVGHHLMVGRIIVLPEDDVATNGDAAAGGGAQAGAGGDGNGEGAAAGGSAPEGAGDGRAGAGNGGGAP